MPQPVKRNSGPSVKEESVFGFFPAAKDIRALQSKRQWESVKKLLTMMRKQDGIPSGLTGSPQGSTETRQKKPPSSGIVGITAASHSNASNGLHMPTLPPLLTSDATPGVRRSQGQVRDCSNNGMMSANCPVRQMGPGARRRPPARSTSFCASPATAQAQEKTRAFKNLTLIGYSCGDIKQEEINKTDLFFHRSVLVRPRYFYVHPEWLSEGIIARHLTRDLRPSPFRYGWP